jgi:Fe-S-cluster containining protein
MCCTWLAVETIGKACGVPCEHLTAHGCGIYEMRPDECRIFTCAWLVGMGDVSVRPDRLNGVVTAAPERQLIVIFTPDLDLPERSAYVRKLLAVQGRRGHGLILVKGDEPRKIWAKEEDMERIMALSATEQKATGTDG